MYCISLWPGARDLRPEVVPAASKPGHALLTQLPSEVTPEKEARAGLPVSKEQSLHSMTPLWCGTILVSAFLHRPQTRIQWPSLP